MRYRTILITGGAGFVGSNLAVKFKKDCPKLRVVALDNLKRRGSELNIIRLKENGVHFVHGDVRSTEDLMLNSEIDLLIECSAEPSVLAGFGQNPAQIININLLGTMNCLELARRNKADFIFLSTSRVYPYAAINNINTIELETRFDWVDGQEIEGWSKEGIAEDFTKNGLKTLYGATKFASELILQEYISMYGIKGVINRCGVIAGPWQFGKVDQGVFTLWMLAHYFKRELRYIGFGGRGKQVRDLLHVDDLFELINLEISSFDKINGKVYNVGGGRQISLSLLETTKLCEEISGNYLDIRRESNNRPGDIKIYLTDNKQALHDLGWQPKRSPSEILLSIYNWIRDKEYLLKHVIE